MTYPRNYDEEAPREVLAAGLERASAEIRRLQELAAARVSGQDPPSPKRAAPDRSSCPTNAEERLGSEGGGGA